MSSIILLRNDNDHLKGRGILFHGGRLFQRDLPAQPSVEAILSGEEPDVIIAAHFGPRDAMEEMVRKLTSTQASATVYLVGSDLDPDIITRVTEAGAQDAFPAPIESEELLIHVLTDLGSAAQDCAIDPLEWDACCSLLHQEEPTTGTAASGTDDKMEEALVRLEAERQELELERQLLAQERTSPPEAGRPSVEKTKELERRASELEEQRYEFEEQKVFLMDAQREVEAARLAWEDERSNLEKSNEELLKQLEVLQRGGAGGGDNDQKSVGPRGWLRSSIGSLPLAKGGRNQNGALTASEIRELSGRLNAATEARRGLEAELEEVSRSAAQARTRQVELEQEVAELRTRYERTGGGGTVSGGSLLERLERLSEKHATFQADLKSTRDRRSALKLQIETLASELSGQEISEALTPAHLQRIREVKTQRKQLQETEASLAIEEAHLIEDLEQNDSELLMIESWIDELEGAREQITQLKRSRSSKTTEPFEPDAGPLPGDDTKPVASEAKPAKPIQHPPRKRKGGLSRRFALRGMA